MERAILEDRWPTVRDILSFCVGVYIVISQLQGDTAEPTALALGAGLMGVPAMLGAVKKNGKA